jgi:hypothetical protein
MVQTMFGEKCVQQLRNVPLSNNIVTRRIADISEDSEQQLTGSWQTKSFSVDIDTKRLIVVVFVT